MGKLLQVASISQKLTEIDGWLRNRLRYCIWIPHGQAYAWSRTRIACPDFFSGGGWAVAQSPILGTTITIKRLEMRGYISLMEYYKQVRHH